MTFPNKENEVGFTQGDWPGINKQANYSEKLLVGYRWYEAHGVKPAFAVSEPQMSRVRLYSY